MTAHGVVLTILLIGPWGLIGVVFVGAWLERFRHRPAVGKDRPGGSVTLLEAPRRDHRSARAEIAAPDPQRQTAVARVQQKQAA